MSNVTIMTNQYLETALWSSSDWDDMDDSGNPTSFDRDYGIYDFTDEAETSARNDCKKFLYFLQYTPCADDSNLLDQALELQDYEQLGHDLWLTRNGHGCGFWDGDYGDIGDILTNIVKRNFPEVNPYVDSDGKVDWL